MVTDEERDYLWTHLRRRPARAHQSRHPPPPGAAAGERPAQDRADELAAALDARHAGRSTTATRSAWATTSISATATACARRCSGRPTATAASRRADPQRLYLPPIQDPIYGFQAVNVEAQARRPGVAAQLDAAHDRGAPAAREAFGRGALRFLYPAQPQDPRLSARARGRAHPLRRQPVARGAGGRARPVGSSRGAVPIELTGGAAFPPIGDLPYLLTLPAYGFFWFLLATEADAPRWHAAGRRSRCRNSSRSSLTRRLRATLLERPRARASSSATSCRDFLPQPALVRRQGRAASPRSRLRRRSATCRATRAALIARSDVTTPAGETAALLPAARGAVGRGEPRASARRSCRARWRKIRQRPAARRAASTRPATSASAATCIAAMRDGRHDRRPSGGTLRFIGDRRRCATSTSTGRRPQRRRRAEQRLDHRRRPGDR